MIAEHSNTERFATLLDACIAVIDDEPANVRLLELLLKQAGYTNIVATTDSARALELIAASAPDLILLDLQMPPPDGYEILDVLQREAQAQSYLPVLVLTADATRPARDRALTLGARDFLVKPLDPVEVSLRIKNLLETRHLYVELAHQNDVLDHRVRQRTSQLDKARLETLKRLALAAEYRDDDTQQHAQRVGRTAALLAAEIDLPDAQIRRLRQAAPLHDVGKIAVPDAILLKPGRLTHDEYEAMKAHTTVGAQILAGSTSRVLRLAEEIALTHHERWDGTGYPRGLEGEEIALSGRLVAIADVFDALTHERPYKQAWSLQDALAEIVRMGGTQLDPSLVAAFSKVDHLRLLDGIDAR